MSLDRSLLVLDIAGRIAKSDDWSGLSQREQVAVLELLKVNTNYRKSKERYDVAIAKAQKVTK